MGMELEINRAATVSIEARENRYEDTFLIYDKAIALNPENANAWYNRACICALQDSPEKALSDLIKAIQLNSEEYKTLATSETDFKSIQTDPRFIERTQ